MARRLAERILNVSLVVIAVAAVAMFNKDAHDRLAALFGLDPVAELSLVQGQLMGFSKVVSETASSFTGDHPAAFAFALAAIVLSGVMLRM
jgi:hypothetical protein